MGDAEHLDNWQQQLEEVTVLQSICGEDFTVLAEGFSSSGDGDAAGPCEELAATLPAEPLECQAAIHVELPSDGLALAVSWQPAECCISSVLLAMSNSMQGEVTGPSIG